MLFIILSKEIGVAKRIYLDEKAVIESYSELKSCELVGKVFGVSGNKIQDVLKSNNVNISKLIDITGQKYGKLLCIERMPVGFLHPKKGCWKFLCDCGNICYHLHGCQVISRRIVSCGCHSKESCRFQYKGYERISGAYWNRCKKGAVRRDLPFSITLEYAWNILVEQDFKCSLTDIPLQIDPHLYYKNGIKQTASIDRINNDLGYIEGNIQWVHKDINWMKQDFTQEEFIQYAEMIVIKNNRNKDENHL